MPLIPTLKRQTEAGRPLSSRSSWEYQDDQGYTEKEGDANKQTMDHGGEEHLTSSDLHRRVCHILMTMHTQMQGMDEKRA